MVFDEKTVGESQVKGHLDSLQSLREKTDSTAKQIEKLKEDLKSIKVEANKVKKELLNQVLMKNNSAFHEPNPNIKPELKVNVPLSAQVSSYAENPISSTLQVNARVSSKQVSTASGTEPSAERFI